MFCVVSLNVRANCQFSIIVIILGPEITDINTTKDNRTESTSALSTDVLTITAVVSALCSFTVGIVVGGVLTQCCGKWCKRKQRSETTDYANIGPNTKASIELQQNEAAYESIN